MIWGMKYPIRFSWHAKQWTVLVIIIFVPEFQTIIILWAAERWAAAFLDTCSWNHGRTIYNIVSSRNINPDRKNPTIMDLHPTMNLPAGWEELWKKINALIKDMAEISAKNLRRIKELSSPVLPHEQLQELRTLEWWEFGSPEFPPNQLEELQNL